MNVAVWTVLAVFAGFSFSTLFYLGHRIDQLGNDLRAEIRDVGAGLGARFDTHLDRHAQIE